MVGESLREDLTDIDLDDVCKGFPDKNYSKRLCFRWPEVDPRFYYGCHGAVRPGGSWRATDCTPSSTWRP